MSEAPPPCDSRKLPADQPRTVDLLKVGSAFFADIHRCGLGEEKEEHGGTQGATGVGLSRGARGGPEVSQRRSHKHWDSAYTISRRRETAAAAFRFPTMSTAKKE